MNAGFGFNVPRNILKWHFLAWNDVFMLCCFKRLYIDCILNDCIRNFFSRKKFFEKIDEKNLIAPSVLTKCPNGQPDNVDRGSCISKKLKQCWCHVWLKIDAQIPRIVKLSNVFCCLFCTDVSLTFFEVKFEISSLCSVIVHLWSLSFAAPPWNWQWGKGNFYEQLSLKDCISKIVHWLHT